MAGRAGTLVGHGRDYEEWGVSGQVRVDPGAAGRGLALSVGPGGEVGKLRKHRCIQAMTVEYRFRDLRFGPITHQNDKAYGFTP